MAKDTTGLYMTYLMDGLTKINQKGLGGNFIWEIWDMGDFNGDGKTDILWRKNTNGLCMIQLMEGRVPGPYRYVGGGFDHDIWIINLADEAVW